MNDNRFKVSGRAGAAPSHLSGRVLEKPGRFPLSVRPGTYHNPVKIFGPIGAAGFGLVDLDEALAKHPGPPLVEIHSDGGDTRAGLAIAERIDQIGATVEAHAVASAAVLPLIAGHRRTLARNGWIGTHPAWQATAGGAVELEAAAQALKATDALLAEALARWTNLIPDQAAQAIARGKVWTPDEALAAGMIDSIGPESDRAAPRPPRLDDGPARQFDILKAAAERQRQAEAHQRAQAEAEAGHQVRPEIAAIIQGNATAVLMEFATPRPRLAAIFDAAAGHTKHAYLSGYAEPWTPRWRCDQCGALNYSPPAVGTRTARCFTCNQPTNEEPT